MAAAAAATEASSLTRLPQAFCIKSAYLSHFQSLSLYPCLSGHNSGILWYGHDSGMGPGHCGMATMIVVWPQAVLGWGQDRPIQACPIHLPAPLIPRAGRDPARGERRRMTAIRVSGDGTPGSFETFSPSPFPDCCISDQNGNTSLYDCLME
jgi:hypothetical protein